MQSMPSLKIKTKAGPPLQASKWLKYPLLVDVAEMHSLIQHLGDFWIFLTSGLTRPGEECLSKQQFLECYEAYVTALKRGELLEESVFRTIFSSVFTSTADALYKIVLADQQLVKVEYPVVQLQHHKFDYSAVDGKFRSMVLGSQSLFWGIQFSYPQLFQDSNMEVKQVKQGNEFPNTELFRRIQLWIRQNTVATPFLVEQKRVNVPIRLGKQCFSWINQHPQLQARGLQILLPHDS